jgi:hypothetical protein
MRLMRAQVEDRRIVHAHTPSSLAGHAGSIPVIRSYVPPQFNGILRYFSRHFYEALSGRRARCVPDRFGMLPVLLVPAFLPPVKAAGPDRVVCNRPMCS